MLFFKYLSKLPFFVLYGISNFIYLILFRVVGYRKKVVYENLRNSFPQKSELEINKIAKDFYHHISDMMVEFVKGYTIPEKEMRERVKLVNFEVIKKYTDKNQSVILVTGHISNWEWLLHPLNLTGVMIDFVYLPLNSPFFEKLSSFIRTRFTTNPLIPKSDALRMTAERHDITRVLALGSDQSPSNWKSAYWTTFLHQESAFFTGTERIAKKFGYPVVFSEMRRIKRGYYEMEFTEIARVDEFNDLEEGVITERFIKRLEATVNKYPSEYLWSHRRWKLKRVEGEELKANFGTLKS